MLPTPSARLPIRRDDSPAAEIDGLDAPADAERAEEFAVGHTQSAQGGLLLLRSAHGPISGRQLTSGAVERPDLTHRVDAQSGTTKPWSNALAPSTGVVVFGVREHSLSAAAYGSYVTR